MLAGESGSLAEDVERSWLAAGRGAGLGGGGTAWSRSVVATSLGGRSPLAPLGAGDAVTVPSMSLCASA